MKLVRYTEDPDPTPYTAYTEEDADPTLRIELLKSDAIWEAQEGLRRGAFEVAGFWLLVADGL